MTRVMNKSGLLSLACRQFHERGHSPAIIYFDRILRESLRYFEETTAVVPHRQCLYSVKAASFPFLLKRMYAHRIAGFDASSSTEANFLANIFNGRIPLYVTAPSLSQEDLQWLRPHKFACVHLDSLNSLELFLKEAPEIPLGIRINPGLGFSRVSLHQAGGTASRLGLPLCDLDTALNLFREYGRNDFGLHFHLTCEAQDFSIQAEVVNLLSKTLSKPGLLNNLQLTHLDMGGGLKPPAWDFNTDTLIPRLNNLTSVHSLASAVDQFIIRLSAHISPNFQTLFETGDFLACSAAIMISKVIETRTTISGDHHMILDTNINHFPNVLHYDNRPNVVYTEDLKAGDQEYRLSGKSCLGGDTFATINVSANSEINQIIFDERGSYEYTQYNFFNGRLRPHVFLLDENGYLQACKIDTPHDLHAFWREEVTYFPEPYQSFEHLENVAREDLGLHLYNQDMRMISSFELDLNVFTPPDCLHRSISEGFLSYAGNYGRSLGKEEIREAISAYENAQIGQNSFYSRDHVALTLGSTNAIWLTLQTLLIGRGQRLLIACPGYYQFANTASEYGIPWTAIHRQVGGLKRSESMQLDPKLLVPSMADIADAIELAPDIGALVINNPGLPYGRRSPAELCQLAQRARDENWLLIVDETLAGLDFGHNSPQDWSWLQADHPVLRMHSISKTFGMAGLRIGYLALTTAARAYCLHGDALKRMAALADTVFSAPPNVLSPAMLAGLDILSRYHQGDWQEPNVRQYKQNLERLAENARFVGNLLEKWEIPYVPPLAGSSLMACLPKLSDCRHQSHSFCRELLHTHKIFLEPGGFFMQNPDWPFTVVRLGLGRSTAKLEKDIADFCSFYHQYQI